MISNYIKKKRSIVKLSEEISKPKDKLLRINIQFN